MTHSARGRFITLEGIEGAGKTTVLQLLHKYLTAQHISFVQTREPGGTPIAESIRQVLLKNFDELMSPDAELLLMFAGRAQNIAQVILPALKRGQWVISDRFTDASFAYQGGGRGVPVARIEQLAQWVHGNLEPDLTILLDVAVETGLARVHSRGARDRIESEGVEFFNRVRDTYLQLAAANPQRFCIINANTDLPHIEKQVIAAVERLLPSTV